MSNFKLPSIDINSIQSENISSIGEKQHQQNHSYNDTNRPKSSYTRERVKTTPKSEISNDNSEDIVMPRYVNRKKSYHDNSNYQIPTQIKTNSNSTPSKSYTSLKEFDVSYCPEMKSQLSALMSTIEQIEKIQIDIDSSETQKNTQVLQEKKKQYYALYLKNLKSLVRKSLKIN